MKKKIFKLSGLVSTLAVLIVTAFAFPVFSGSAGGTATLKANFENGTDGFTSTGGTIEVSNEQAFDGEKSLKIVSTGVKNDVELKFPYALLPRNVGDWVNIHVYVPTGSNLGQLQLVNRYGESYTAVYVPAVFIDSSKRDTWLTLSYQIPAGQISTAFSVYMKTTANPTTGNNIAYVDSYWISSRQFTPDPTMSFEVSSEVDSSFSGTGITKSRSNEQASAGIYSMKIVGNGNSGTYSIQSSSYKPSAGQSIQFQVYVPSAGNTDPGNVTVRYQKTSDKQWVSGPAVVDLSLSENRDVWIAVSAEIPEAIDYFGLTFQNDSGSARPLTVYVDAFLRANVLDFMEQPDLAAQSVETAIAAIGTVTPGSEPTIAAARVAFDGLNEAQKMQVSNTAVLTAAESVFAGFRPAMLGAAIRTTSPQGLRFGTQVSCGDISGTGWTLVKCGTVMLSSTKYTGGALAIDYSKSRKSEGTPVAGNNFVYAVTITNISVQNESTDIYARSYLVYQKNGTEEFVTLYNAESDSAGDPSYSCIRSVNGVNELMEKTEKLAIWLKSQYGKKIIAGQQYGGRGLVETVVIYRETGKLPALMGFDFTGTEEDSEYDEHVKAAITWHRNSNGIVTFSWHWRVPKDMSGDKRDTTFYTKSDKYPDGTTFDITRAVLSGTEENKLILQHIDNIAGQLRRLKLAGIPVLFRPLHEASGGWFWWGAKGSTAYKKLWNIMYDRLENYHKLTNLIWVWNGQSVNWLVDADKYDMAGYDSYPATNLQGSQIAVYNAMNSYTQKPIALTECGPIPDVDQLISDEAKWLWWMTWNKEFVYKNVGGDIVASPEYTPAAQLKKNYNSSYVITLEDLPQWSTDTKKDLPAEVKAFKETGKILGGNPVWKNGVITLEFEYATELLGCQLSTELRDYSGFGMVLYKGKIDDVLEKAMFTIDVAEEGTYTAMLRYYGEFGPKINALHVNDGRVRIATELTTGFATIQVEIQLKKGGNEIGFSYVPGDWGWVWLDNMVIAKKQ